MPQAPIEIGVTTKYVGKFLRRTKDCDLSGARR